MGLLAAFKGDILHFNKNAVPVLNEIFAKLNSLEESEEKERLLKMLVISNSGIDALFHSDTGLIRNEVKKFDKEDINVSVKEGVAYIDLNVDQISAIQLRKIIEKVSETNYDVFNLVRTNQLKFIVRTQHL